MILIGFEFLLLGFWSFDNFLFGLIAVLESSLASFKPSFYAGNMLVADPEGNISSLNPQSGKESWKINLDRGLAAGVASGFGKLIVSDLNGFVIAIDSETQEIIWEKNIIHFKYSLQLMIQSFQSMKQCVNQCKN